MIWISIFILITIWILISHTHPMPPPGPSDGRPRHGGGWGDINIHIDINMNIDIHIIINMSIEDYIRYYTLLITIFQEKSKISKNRWIWHFYNVFRSAKPIQIQPTIQNLINKPKTSQQIRILFEFAASRSDHVFHWENHVFH